jgi:hypothetical protein
MAVDPSAAEALLADLHAHGVRWAARIGTFIEQVGRIAIDA